MSSSQFIETATGNRVSRSSTLCGPQNIHILGKTTIEDDVIIRGDFANVRVGRNCVLSNGVVVRPAHKRTGTGVSFLPSHIGDNVFIDESSLIESASIGSNVYIGKNCIISKRCIIKDCCWIKDGTVLSEDTVIPPFSLYSGCPGRFEKELPMSSMEMIKTIVESKKSAVVFR
mmetsp:Transcript_13843/g.15778  ORF Transcript_13843/g.15778 Transcript_13843/m.15778 type:complete len:173 (+) Transcript_13843:124-642(+)